MIYFIWRKRFSVFAAAVPLFNSSNNTEAYLWLMIPENVMLYWPKVGVLGIIILGLVLTWFLLRKLSQFTQKNIAPISELVDEVNKIRQSFDQESSMITTPLSN